jgi:hypothetical protein
MAKKANSYNRAPWTMKAKEFATFRAVNEGNRKNAIVLGRVLYVISKGQYRGYFDVRPRLVKCRMSITNHPHMADQKVYIPEDESVEEYKKSFDSLITSLISEGSLYINIKDTLIKYSRL